eukprot:304401-Amphidinium_carterae.1
MLVAFNVTLCLHNMSILVNTLPLAFLTLQLVNGDTEQTHKHTHTHTPARASKCTHFLLLGCCRDFSDSDSNSERSHLQFLRPPRKPTVRVLPSSTILLMATCWAWPRRCAEQGGYKV